MGKTVDLKKSKTSIAQFNLVGVAKVNDYTFTIDQTSEKSDWIWNTLNLGIDCGECGIIYAEMKGGYGSDRDNVVYVHGKKKNDNDKDVDDFDNRYTISWDDRFKNSILEDIGEKCFLKVGIEKDVKDKTVEKKFLSAYDAVAYIQEHLEDGMVVNVKGNIKYKEYDGNTQVTKEITSIFLSKAEEKDYRATFKQTILCGYDFIGKYDKENETFALNTYVLDYVGKVNNKKINKTFAFDRSFEFDSKGDEEKAKKVLVKYFKPKKKDEIAEINVEGKITKNGNSVDITMDDIPEDIQELIELGIYTKEEVLAKGTNGGNKKESYVIEKPVIVVNKKDDGTATTVIQANKNALKTENLVFLSSLDLDEEIQEEQNDEDEKEEESTDEIKDDFDLDDLFNEDEEE
jgi:hypothetical protein